MTRRKHWYEIRAWADGWEIETQDAAGIWFSASAPSFYEKSKYRIVPDSEGWLPWYGGECPVGNDVKVDVKLKSGNYWWNLTVDSFFWDGDKDSIIAYRIIKEADPYAELKAAAKDPTKEVWDKVANVCIGHISEKLPVSHYEIRDKPKTKKVKLLAYLTPESAVESIGFRRLQWITEYKTPKGWNWKRVPAEDKEIEVEL